ncbi:MAG: caspase family protein [Muribaculaceae bacterium]|nr:caspase family protein [Muribaculaceae bacterium]
MKKLLFTLLMIFAMISGVSARTYVLVTGVSNYGDESSNLAQTTKDAKRFRDLMLTQTKDVTILTSKYVTRANVLEKLRAICNRAGKDDRIVFFYSGHGSPGGICGYDKLISYDDLMATLSQSEAKEKVCLIDACFAGTAGKSSNDQSWRKEAKAAKDIAFLVSCRPEEISAEDPLLGAGLFTEALLKGMRGKSDEDGNREITLLELFKYIHKDVVKHSKDTQHPQLIAPKSMHNIVMAKW